MKNDKTLKNELIKQKQQQIKEQETVCVRLKDQVERGRDLYNMNMGALEQMRNDLEKLEKL